MLSTISLWGTACAAASVTLAWDPSPAPSLAGYRLYEGLVSQTYTTVMDVGLTTSATVNGLIQGLTYFFAVTVYDTNGLESAFSGEVSYTVPITGAALQMTVNHSGQVVLGGTAPLGYQYEVQACSTLADRTAANWTTIGRLTLDIANTFEFIDPGSATNNSRFYRLHQTFP